MGKRAYFQLSPVLWLHICILFLSFCSTQYVSHYIHLLAYIIRGVWGVWLGGWGWCALSSTYTLTSTQTTIASPKLLDYMLGLDKIKTVWTPSMTPSYTAVQIWAFFNSIQSFKQSLKKKKKMLYNSSSRCLNSYL